MLVCVEAREGPAGLSSATVRLLQGILGILEGITAVGPAGTNKESSERQEEEDGGQGRKDWSGSHTHTHTYYACAHAHANTHTHK